MMYASTKASTKDRFLSSSPQQSPIHGGIQKMFDVLEGPGVMRGLSAVCGATLVIGTAADLILRKKRLLGLETPSLVLRLYVVMFGLTIVLNELKSVQSEQLQNWRDFVFKWMPFLSVTLGKGLFMVLTSSVGLAFQSTVLVWGPSIAVCAVGLIYCAFYVYDRKEQDAAIGASMAYSPVPSAPSAWV